MDLYAWCYRDPRGCLRVLEVSEEMYPPRPVAYVSLEEATRYRPLAESFAEVKGWALELRHFTASEFDDDVLDTIDPRPAGNDGPRTRSA